MDILQSKWFGDLPCIDREMETSDIGQPTPLGVDAFLGVFLMLGCGILAGVVILCLEHAFYHYALPKLRQSPPDSIWRNQNMMFVSQVRQVIISALESAASVGKIKVYSGSVWAEEQCTCSKTG